MKKLIFKTTLFTAPFFILFLIYAQFYSNDKGDLSRLGYISNTINYDFNVLFEKEITSKVNFSLLSKLNLKSENKFTVLTIGDSFSEQGGMSYQNYLVENPSLSVVHYDRFLHDNPLETVNGLLNGDVLNTLKVDYIILQSVERSLVQRALEYKKNTKTTTDSLKSLIQKHEEKSKEKAKEETKKDKFFSKDIILFPLNTIFYNYKDKGFSSRAHQVKTTKNLFITNNNKLLFLDDDYHIVPVNNDVNNVQKLNLELNDLSKRLKAKGIQLIVLPSPDKFDFYYDDIVNKNEYTRPLFFDLMRDLKKDYIYIDSKKILQDKTKNTSDVYFYDDTHWSPIATKIISAEIKMQLKNNSQK